MDKSISKESELIYHYVKVITKLKKSSGFTSDFLYDCDINDDKHILTFSGYLKTIDPISRSVILSRIDKNNKTVMNNILILGQHIENIKPCKNNSIENDTETKELTSSEIENIFQIDCLNKLDNHPYFKRERKECQLTDEELHKLQEDIITWLKKNRIPVELDLLTNNIIVGDHARIKAPYEHISDYICPTRVVLKRIKHIIDSRNYRDKN